MESNVARVTTARLVPPSRESILAQQVLIELTNKPDQLTTAYPARKEVETHSKAKKPVSFVVKDPNRVKTEPHAIVLELSILGN